MSQVEINDIRYQLKTDPSKVGATSFININRFAKNEETNSQKYECRRLLEILERNDPNKAVNLKMNQIRQVTPRKIKEIVIK